MYRSVDNVQGKGSPPHSDVHSEVLNKRSKKSAQMDSSVALAERGSHQWYCPPLRSRSVSPKSEDLKVSGNVPYAVGAMLAISAIASKVLLTINVQLLLKDNQLT